MVHYGAVEVRHSMAENDTIQYRTKWLGMTCFSMT